MAKGFLLVHPYGRGSQGYYADGEADVWDVWRIVSERWRVDPERVYLAGFSMGGRRDVALVCLVPGVVRGGGGVFRLAAGGRGGQPAVHPDAFRAGRAGAVRAARAGDR